MTILEKVVFVLENTKKNEKNQMFYPSDFVNLFFKGDPDLEIVEKKSTKVIDLFNEAILSNDVDFLNRDFETDVWNLI